MLLQLTEVCEIPALFIPEEISLLEISLLGLYFMF